MIFRKDNFGYGLALGFVAPMAGFLIYKFIRFQTLTLSEMFQWLRMNPNLISGTISISLLANVTLFTIFINGHRDNTAKGIFVITILYGIIALLFKYL